MALVNFKKGRLANLPEAKTPGTLYMTTDERGIYLDVDGNTRIRFGDFQEFDTVALLEANQNPSTTALYYVKDINCLAKWDGSKYVQINLDTGATSIEVVGTGNAVTAANYDQSTRKITLTKGETFLTGADISDITSKVEQAEQDIAALELLVGEDSVEDQIQDAIADLKLDETYDELGAAEDALTQAKAYADDLDEAMDERVGALEDKEDTWDTAATDVAAIKSDYLKSTDKSALEDAIGKKADSTTVSALDKRVEDLEENDDEQDGRLDALESTIAGLSGAMHFKGVVGSDPTKITEGYNNGDVVIYGNKEYVWNNGAFVEFGDVTEESARIGSLENRMTNAESDIDDVESDLADEIQRAEAAEAAAEDNAKKYADGLNSNMDTRVKALEDKKDAWDGAVTKSNANADAITAIKDGETLDSFGDVESALGEITTGEDINDFGAVEAALAALDEQYDAIGAADEAEKSAKAYTDTKLTWGDF